MIVKNNYHISSSRSCLLPHAHKFCQVWAVINGKRSFIQGKASALAWLYGRTNKNFTYEAGDKQGT